MPRAASAALSRRSLLRAGLVVPIAPMAGSLAGGHLAELRALERRHGARLGVYATNTRTGATVAYRAAERFPMCSTFKTFAAAAILRDRDRDGEFLNRVIHYAESDLVPWSPITAEHAGVGMRVSELCAAAICYSDNTAGNLLLHQIGGPGGITRFCRSIGDPHSRLDRYETALNSAVPGDPRDTTTPGAIGRSYRELVLGHALCPADRARLAAWLKANTTSAKRFRAGLPGSWEIGDKTGTGAYGTANDVGVAWATDGSPLVLAVLSTKDTEDAAPDDALIADTARLLARTLAPAG
ncbi:class A beta-lactamase [Actinomycetes bacterium KLBMP 9797]